MNASKSIIELTDTAYKTFSDYKIILNQNLFKPTWSMHSGPNQQNIPSAKNLRRINRTFPRCIRKTNQMIKTPYGPSQYLRGTTRLIYYEGPSRTCSVDSSIFINPSTLPSISKNSDLADSPPKLSGSRESRFLIRATTSLVMSSGAS